MPLYNYMLVNTLITFDLENVSRSYIGALAQRRTIKRMYFFSLLSRSNLNSQLVFLRYENDRG